MRIKKVCYTPPPEGIGNVARPTRRAASQIAVQERVDNIRVRSMGPPGRNVARATVEIVKLWANGRRLRVRFLDGDPGVQAKVQQIAKEWEAYANLALDFVGSGASEIRVSFAEKGFSWSTVGTDALGVRGSQATMNFGWLEPSTSLREYQRVVRHEFGHALGLIHEHQNPAAAGVIPWDKPKVYAYYANQGWSQGDVDFNIFQTYGEDDTNFTAFDPTSIMEYPVPDSLTVGSYAIGWNTSLSDLDKDFMRRQYPLAAPAMADLVVGGAKVAADIGAAGEVDTFHLDITQAATYILTTEGATDTMLTVLGPGDPGAVLAWDDDLGKATNARVVRRLEVGKYWITVRHKDPTATGSYDIGVTKRRS